MSDRGQLWGCVFYWPVGRLVKSVRGNTHKCEREWCEYISVSELHATHPERAISSLTISSSMFG